MKIIILLISTAILFSCTQKSNGIPGVDENRKIQQEIKPLIAQIYEAAARLDTTKLYDVFSFAGDDFVYIETTGAFYDKTAYKQMVRHWYGMITSEIIEKGLEKYVYVSGNNVVWSYSGALTLIYKNGERVKYEPFGMTFIFKKINNKWKAVFLQESTQEPAQADTTKK
jgi:ketosteroid isomerase-like protein